MAQPVGRGRRCGAIVQNRLRAPFPSGARPQLVASPHETGRDMPTNEFIHQTHRELGTATDAARASREFLTLPGELPKDRVSPNYQTAHEFTSRYGYQTRDDSRDLEMLVRTMEESVRLGDESKQFANRHAGQDVLNGAGVTLRKLTCAKQSIIPLFTGSTMSTFAAAKALHLGPSDGGHHPRREGIGWRVMNVSPIQHGTEV